MTLARVVGLLAFGRDVDQYRFQHKARGLVLG
jgi:hypothetical protein